MTISQRAEFIATFRWIEVKLMEMLAAWVATTPEMEIKVLFGRHVWECAQHADALGKRTFELRAPLHFTLAPSPGYCELVAQSARIMDSAQRIAQFYEIILPGLLLKYENYLKNTDQLMDEPSVRVVQSIVDSTECMRQESKELCETECPIKRIEDMPDSLFVFDTFENFVVHQGHDKQKVSVSA